MSVLERVGSECTNYNSISAIRCAGVTRSVYAQLAHGIQKCGLYAVCAWYNSVVAIRCAGVTRSVYMRRAHNTQQCGLYAVCT